MDYQLCRNQLDEHDHQPSAKVPKLHHVEHQQHSPDYALALFAPEPNTNTNKTTPTLSAFPDSTPTRFSRLGGLFSLAQWQELQLQALIYKYMLAGASVPLELILPLRKSLVSSSPYYYNAQQYQHCQPAMLQTGYWGRCVIDPEPGRCRRTDGKKWRCSREVVAGQKYCERHVHRGRNRSRKHVELPTPAGSSGFKATTSSLLEKTKETQFTLSGQSPTLDILPLIQRPPDGKTVDGCLPQCYCPNFSPKELQGERSDSRVLMRFFDDWPRSEQEPPTSSNNASSAASTTHLSISIPGNSSSDFSLKLSTGNTDKPRSSNNKDSGIGWLQPALANWSGWGNHGEASMGGPLAEALRSSTSTPSPTSVFQKANGSVSETSSTSTW